MAANYGTGVPQPTGHGLPGYENSTFATRPPASEIIWCEIACVPRNKCIHCKLNRKDQP
jgi:hypothetical protein